MKLLLPIAAICAVLSLDAVAQKNDKKLKGATSRPAAVKSKGVVPVRTLPAAIGEVELAPSAPVIDFPDCMDSYCKSADFKDKGRCRCSTNLGKIETVLRNIEAVSRQADELARDVEAQMNLGAGSPSDMADVARLIGDIERSAKGLAAGRIDENLDVAEGPALHKAALERCEAALPADEERAGNMQKAYQSLIEKDCGDYTTILKEKADTVGQLMIQAQKNAELFATQEFRARNQLEPGACRLEYESCVRRECGEGMRLCRGDAATRGALERCQIINENKCEDIKAVILVEMKKLIEEGLSRK